MAHGYTLRVPSAIHHNALHGDVIPPLDGCHGLYTGAVLADSGKTQIAQGTRTAAAIGPGPADVIDIITSGLRLLGGRAQ